MMDTCMSMPKIGGTERTHLKIKRTGKFVGTISNPARSTGT